MQVVVDVLDDLVHDLHVLQHHHVGVEDAGLVFAHVPDDARLDAHDFLMGLVQGALEARDLLFHPLRGDQALFDDAVLRMQQKRRSYGEPGRCGNALQHHSFGLGTGHALLPVSRI